MNNLKRWLAVAVVIIVAIWLLSATGLDDNIWEAFRMAGS